MLELLAISGERSVYWLIQPYFSLLPLAPPTGNKEKYGWLARLDEDMKLKIRQSRPESLQALETALELESHQFSWQVGNEQG